MAKYQTGERTTSAASTDHKNSKQSKNKKSKNKKVFSLGFITLSLTIAVMVFFTLFIIGMQIGPSLGI